MSLPQAVVDNAANAALDFHMDRGKVHEQHIQEKPLLRELRRRQKSFPGGKGNLTVDVAFETFSTIEGFSADDTLNFVNPTPIKQAAYPWKQTHTGIYVTTEELLKDGISVVDTNGQSTSEHSQRELTALANILETKLADMSEGWSAGMNEMFWLDGTQDSKEVPGVPYFISDDPTTGIVGGIDRAAQPKWRNISLAGANAINSGSVSIIRTLQKQVRQIRRFGSPRLLVLCGSDFLNAVEDDLYSKGQFTNQGFDKNVDVGMGEISVRGLGRLMYDPTLDDQGKSKYGYFIDTNAIQLRPIEGEDMKKHYPARPHNKMVIYRSVTWAGGLVARQLNTSMVAAIQ